MASVTGMTIIKKFPYRGDANEEFSNQYWFSGSPPANDTDWLALFTALVNQEKLVYTSRVSIIAGYGYNDDADNAHAAWVHDIAASPIAGAGGWSSTLRSPGDAAVVARWKTSRTNSRGKPVYLRKYFHDVYYAGASTPDTVLDVQLAALNTFATKLKDGSFIDARTLRSQKHSETLLTGDALPFITTRTLRRRGKRPS